MAAPFQDFTRILSALMRFAKGASYVVIGFFLLFAALRVADGFRFFAAIEPALGWLFLAAVLAAFYLFIGRPVLRFMAMPAVVRPPELPPESEREAKHVVRHLEFVERYLGQLGRNPEWAGSPEAIERGVAACRTLRDDAARLEPAHVFAFGPRLRALEREHVDPLLAPLDRKAREAIRQEALAVGISTAVSWNGTMDAFLVLWRSCNLASRIARIYYGRPGVRGTFSILRDVSAAALAGAYLQDLTQIAGGAVGSAFGKTVGVLGGPLLEGGLNAVATLRVGYLAQARCRSFQAWTERSRTTAIAGAFQEAARHTKEVVSDIVRTVGGSILRLPGRLLGKAVDALSVLWKAPDEVVEGAARAE